MDASGRILIVDDDPIIRLLMASSLTGAGREIAWVDSGAAAIEQAMALLPDLILLDVLLPGMDGLEVCRRLRAEPMLAEVPIIMITALNDADARLLSLDAGADDFIAKPVDLLELRARVSSILRLNRYRRLLNERTLRQRAEEEIFRRNRELSLLNTFILSTAARLRTPEQIHGALRDACRVLSQVLDLAEARAWLRPECTCALSEHGCESGVEAKAMVAAVGPHGAPQEVAERGACPEVQPGDERTQMAIPLMVSGRTCGALCATAAPGHEFDGQDRSFAQSLASALGQAIEAATLHQQLQRHVDTLEETVSTRTNELQAERDRTQAILDALGEAVVVADSEGIIRYANPAAGELTGAPAAELVGRRWDDAHAGRPADPLYAAIRNYVRAGHTWRGEISGARRDGTAFDAALTAAPIYDPQSGDAPASMVSVQRDITPLKAAERMKDQFISNVSHELRTPLSIIALHSGNLDTLYDRLPDGRRRQLIREIRAQAELLDELIGDVLELSRIDSGRLPGEQESVDLAELLRSEAEQIEPLAERKGLRLAVSAGDAVMVQGDEAHLRQCIRNLLSNAIKFTPAGGEVVGECRPLGAARADQDGWPGYAGGDTGVWAGLRVRDTGVGIEPEHVPHLFERFYRVQNQSKVPGTGLGLAITRELITRHGGWAAVDSLPGEGSTFAFYLPLAS